MACTNMYALRMLLLVTCPTQYGLEALDCHLSNYTVRPAQP